MGAINRVFNRGRLKREQRAKRKELRKQAVPHSSKFILEPLEPRVLLSGDLLPQPAHAAPADSTGPGAIVDFEQPSGNPAAINSDASDVLFADSASADQPQHVPVYSIQPVGLLAVNTWSGDIPNGTVWHAGDVQRIIGDIRVPQGSTLTIQPGAIV